MNMEPRIHKWQCPSCRQWVREEMARVCESCRTAARLLTTVERHQLSADMGVDTWEEHRGER